MSEIVNKSQFARMVNRNPSQVTRWIEEGKLSGAALDGEGRGARIVVDVAKRQLGLTLDAAQQFSQASPLLDLEGSGTEPTMIDNMKLHHLNARNRKMMADATRTEIELDKLRGTLVDVNLVRGAFNVRLQELVGWVDSLPEVIGNPLAEEFSLDKVAFRIALRRMMSAERVRFVAQVQQSLSPELVAA
jgi:hypothetical protein